MYKPTGIDPEIELRQKLEEYKREWTHIMIHLPTYDRKIQQAFKAPKGSVEYMSAGRLVTEQKQMEKRFTFVCESIRRIQKALNIEFVGAT
jgi:hypothetical protein